MEQIVRQTVDFVLGLQGPPAYGLLGFLTWAEAAFFLGLVTPGELAIATGGMLASRGQLALPAVAAVATAGTVTGNVTGYWLGRVWGPRIRKADLFQRYLGRALSSARAYFRERGDRAVVVGAFVSYVRIFVPFLAGLSRMPLRRFLGYGVPAAAVWATAWTLGGFLLGESWRMLQERVGAAAFLVLVLFLLAVAIRWAAGWIARRRDRVVAMARRLANARPVGWVRGLVRAQLRWLGRRFRPGMARGLNLTLGFVVLLAGAAVAGVVLEQARSLQGIALIDFPVLDWMSATRTEQALRVARAGLQPFMMPGFLALTLVLTGAAWWWGGGKAAARAATGMLGAGLGAWLLDRYVLHAVVPRTEFPAVPVAVAAALLVHTTATVGARGSWGKTVATSAGGLFLTSAVALAALVAGWAAPSGLALGFALGLIWSTAVELSARLA